MKKLLLLLLAFGCTVGPDYKAPENTVSNEWSSPAETAAEPPLTEWWKVFNDPLLDKYIEMAAANNQDVLAAEAHILQARAIRQVTASSLFPQIIADVNATKTYFSKNGPVFAIGPSTAGTEGVTTPATTGSVSGTTGLPFQVQVPQIQSLYNALIDVSWEIDLFGKTRRSIQAAEATIESTIEQRNDTLISVMAEVARNYVEIRTNQRRAQLTEEKIAFFEQEARIVEKQLEYGYVSELDLENIQANLASARANLPDLIAQVYRGIYTLSVLTGNMPETLLEELLPVQPMPSAPEKIAAGLRSDLLRRRPDIRGAERALAVATANVGVAVASFFPTITLLGDGGFQSLSIKNLFTARSKTWALGGDINLPIFQGGSLIGNLKASRAATEAAAHVYQQTVLQALEETESALIAHSQAIKTAHELHEATEKRSQFVLITRERHEKGLVNLISLLESQIQLNQTEQTQLDSDSAVLFDLILLYKALGGGWEGKGEGK